MTPSKGAVYHREILVGFPRILHLRHINRSLRQHGKSVTTELERVVSTGPRSGRVYFYRGRAYTASAPGEPPAKRSGALASGFESNARRFDLAIGNTAFAGDAPYPTYLEVGTSRMKPRPYFVKTIERMHVDLLRDLQNGLVLS